MSGPDTAALREQVTRWMRDDDGCANSIPASPDDVLALLDECDRLRARTVVAEALAARYEQALRDLEDVARAALTWAPGNAKIELANRLGAALAAASGEERDDG